jgi:multidrug resistance efflux pump
MNNENEIKKVDRSAQSTAPVATPAAVPAAAQSDPKAEPKKPGMFSKPWAQSVLALVLVFGALGGFLYWQTTKNEVYIENSYLDAPIVSVSATSPGVLNEIYVKEGDKVIANQAVALVGSEIIYAKEGGTVSSAPKVSGGYYAPGQNIASIVVAEKMRVVGSLEENKGLDRIAAGQRVTFLVDAFPGKTYEGTVDEVSPVSADTGVIFSISDKRPTKKFSVYVNLNSDAYPELKSGMSAKIYVDTRI